MGAEEGERVDPPEGDHVQKDSVALAEGTQISVSYAPNE
jgi:hypothetical protein